MWLSGGDLVSKLRASRARSSLTLPSGHFHSNTGLCRLDATLDAKYAVPGRVPVGSGRMLDLAGLRGYDLSLKMLWVIYCFAIGDLMKNIFS